MRGQPAPALLEDYLALRRAEPDRFRRSALVLDIRAGDPAPAIERAAAALAAEGTKLELIFLEASDASLVSRFSETRHRHPLEATRSGVQASIAEERRRLARTRELADHVIDTSGLSIGQLKDRLFAVMPRASVSEELRIDIVTFGFKYGIPLEADLVFDVRFLTNPYWDPELKPLSGLEEPVRDFVLDQPPARRFLDLVDRAPGADRARLPRRGQGAAAGRARLHRAATTDRSRWPRSCAAGWPRSAGASVTVFHRELER